MAKTAVPSIPQNVPRPCGYLLISHRRFDRRPHHAADHSPDHAAQHRAHWLLRPGRGDRQRWAGHHLDQAGQRSESFVVHYSIDGGGRLNYMATYNSSTGRWEQPVTVPAGHTMSYYFDYQHSTQSYRNTTLRYSFTG